jgi:hypothetical protein
VLLLLLLLLQILGWQLLTTDADASCCAAPQARGSSGREDPGSGCPGELFVVVRSRSYWQSCCYHLSCSLTVARRPPSRLPSSPRPAWCASCPLLAAALCCWLLLTATLLPQTNVVRSMLNEEMGSQRNKIKKMAIKLKDAQEEIKLLKARMNELNEFLQM